MQESSANNKRIAKNTLLLYIRMLITMGISLYTSRVVLANLGVTDYGIYNVVGGFVSMFSVINSAMATSTQRYMTYSLAKGDLGQLSKVFNMAIVVHIALALIIALFCETVGLWFLYHKMIIPADRMTAAFWTFQFSVLSLIVMMMSVPYNATIIAHERMSAFAYISVLEVTLKLAIVYLLVLFSSYDKLILYAFLILVVQLIIRFTYNSYCHRHFAETKFKKNWDKSLFRQMASFAGWSLWGNLAGTMAVQGENVLLNIFFGPVVNAARGVAIQVQSAITQFAGNFQTALNPQITKTYAINELSEMHKLIIRSARFSFFMLYLLSLPILLYTPFILSIWLKEVPEYTSIFLKISLVIAIIDSVSNPLMVAAAATGRIRKYQSVVGGMILLIIPISYLLLKMGATPIAVYCVHLFISFITFFLRLYIIRPIISLSLKLYFSNLLKNVTPVALLSLPIPTIASALLDSSNTAILFINIVISVLSVALTVYCFGLEKSERNILNNKISMVFQRIKLEH